MTPQQLKATLLENVRLVPVEPEVKSAKTCELSLCGVSAGAETTKTTDPTCYHAIVGRNNPPTGCLTLWREKMERTVALKTLGKLLGKKLGYRVNAKAPTQEAREAAKAASVQAVEERNKLKEQRDARYRAVLAADAEYQRLHAAHRAASVLVDDLFSITRHYKITVGTSDGMFFLVKAEGDSWEEVIDKLTAKENKAA